MNHYLVAIYWTRPSAMLAYSDSFWAELKRSTKWLNYVPGVWFIARDERHADLDVKLRKLSGPDCYLLLMALPAPLPPVSGWLPEGAWNWFRAAQQEHSEAANVSVDDLPSGSQLVEDVLTFLKQHRPEQPA